MYTLTHIDLDNNTKKNVTLRDLKEYHHFLDKIHDVKELEHSPIANNIDFSIGVLEPLDGAEDFVYVYLNRPVVKFGDKTDNIIGRSYKDLFSNVKEFNSFDCLMRAWNENRRINTIVLIYKDNNLLFALNIYYVREDDYLIIYSKDITDYAKLKQEHEKLFYNSKDGLLIMNYKGEVLHTNNKFFEILGYSIEDFMQVNPLSWILKNVEVISLTDEEYGNMLELLDEVISHRIKNTTFDVKYPLKNGKYGYLHVFAVPTKYENQDVAQISITDITKSKKKEIEALRLHKNLNTIQGMAKIAISSYNFKNIQWTTEIFNILDMDPSKHDYENINTYLDLILDEDRSIFDDAISKLNPDNPQISLTVRVKTFNGKIKYIAQLNKAFYDDDGNCKVVIGFIQDVTQQKVYEDKLRNALSEKNEYADDLELILDEKDVLINEVHDRVKNNLQIIQSILDLEMHFNPDNPSATVRKTYNRVKSMAFAHEQVYDDLDSNRVIDASVYIRQTVLTLFSYYNTKIRPVFELDNITLPLNIVIPLGLILNELCINTIQHAFDKGNEGVFSVVLKKGSENVVLIVKDNGHGAPTDFSPVSDSNLGINIINNLVSQIDGKVEYLSESTGFSVLITF